MTIHTILFALLSLLLPNFMLHAEESPSLPTDLQQLLQNFTQVPKDPQVATSHWRVEAINLEEGKVLTISTLAKQSMEALEKSAVVTDMLASSTSLNARKDILRILTPRRESQLFCEGFAYKELLQKPGEGPLTPEKLKIKKEQHRLNQCRRHLAAIFGGIFYASPKVLLLDIKFKQGEAEHEQLQVLIPSMFNPGKLVRYQVDVR
jgi:hypothetical protein